MPEGESNGRRSDWNFPALLKWILIVGVVLQLFVFIAVKLPEFPGATNIKEEYFVVYPARESESGNAYMQEQSELFDSEPLFLPTHWNYSSEVDVLKVKSYKMALFGAYKPKLYLGNESFYQPVFASIADYNVKNMFSSKYWDAFRNMAKGKIESDHLSLRNAYLRVVGFYDKKTYIEGVINQQDWPVGGLDLWKPFSFIIFSQPAGYMSQPLMLESSGDAGIDSYVMKYLTKITIEWKLDPGYYRVSVGP